MGTGVLRQFVSTIDYKTGALILRRPNGESVRQVLRGGEGKKVVEIPFFRP